MTLIDIGEVTTIIIPINVCTEPTLDDETYDLLCDYAKLHISHVVKSSWCFFSTNMAVTEENKSCADENWGQSFYSPFLESPLFSSTHQHDQNAP